MVSWTITSPLKWHDHDDLPLLKMLGMQAMGVHNKWSNTLDITWKTPPYIMSIKDLGPRLFCRRMGNNYNLPYYGNN
jgi:hypothetical protein